MNISAFSLLQALPFRSSEAGIVPLHNAVSDNSFCPFSNRILVIQHWQYLHRREMGWNGHLTQALIRRVFEVCYPYMLMNISISYFSTRGRNLSADFSLSELREGKTVPWLLHNTTTLLSWILFNKV